MGENFSLTAYSYLQSYKNYDACIRPFLQSGDIYSLCIVVSLYILIHKNSKHTLHSALLLISQLSSIPCCHSGALYSVYVKNMLWVLSNTTSTVINIMRSYWLFRSYYLLLVENGDTRIRTFIYVCIFGNGKHFTFYLLMGIVSYYTFESLLNSKIVVCHPCRSRSQFCREP